MFFQSMICGWSAGGKPASSQKITVGNGSAKSATKSNSSFASIPSISSFAYCSRCGSSFVIASAVNHGFKRRR